MVCLDTDFLIEFDRQQPQAVSRMEEMAAKGEVVSVTLKVHKMDSCTPWVAFSTSTMVQIQPNPSLGGGYTGRTKSPILSYVSS